MEFDRRNRRGPTSEAMRDQASTPGKTTLTESLPPVSSLSPVAAPTSSETRTLSCASPPAIRSDRPTLQMLFQHPAASDPEQVHAAAGRGITTTASQLPHLEKIQHAFGKHDVSGVQAHVGQDATASAQEMGAAAYATGNHVVFGAGTDLHTVAHETAHVIQQRSGVQLKGGVGETGDAYEQHADAVAEKVVRGESAEALLDRFGGGAAAAAGITGPVQRMRIGEVESTTMSYEQVVSAAMRNLTFEERTALIAQCVELIKRASNPTYRAAIEQTKAKLEAGAKRPLNESDEEEGEHTADDSDRMSVDGPPDDTGGKKQKVNSGAAAKTVRYKLSATKSSQPYIDLSEKEMGNEPQDPMQSPRGYLAQVPAHAGGAMPSTIAAKYEDEVFDDRTQVSSRLAMVVGVNSYRDVADNNRNIVNTLVQGANAKALHGFAVGFLWDPMWEKTTEDHGRAKTSELMTASAVAADADAAALMSDDPLYFSKQEMDKTSGVTRQGKVPYGRIRDHIKDHRSTVRLSAELARNNDSVYVHVGDDDALSLRAPATHGVAKSGGGEALGLMSRYDELIAQHESRTGRLPLLASGGYEFKRVADGGDLPDDSQAAEITLIAHRLDREIRDILVTHLGPYAVYYPEPNTLYRVTPENTRLTNEDPAKPIFHDPNDTTGGGSAESQQMVKRLRELNPGEDAIYDPRVAVTTETSGRFREGESHFSEAMQSGVADPVLIKHVVGQNQSHAASGAWIDAAKQGTAGVASAEQPKITEVFVTAVVEAYTVTGKMFDRKARKTFTKDEFADFLTTTLTAPPSGELPPKHSKLAASPVGQRIITAACESNGAIVAAIQKTLALVQGDREGLAYGGSPERKK